MVDRTAIWRAVHEERRRLTSDLQGISPEEWQTPSLCCGWSVHDVVAHLTDSASRPGSEGVKSGETGSVRRSV